MPTAVFFLASNAPTETEQNRISSLMQTHTVRIVPREMLSIEGLLTGAEFVAATKREHIRPEAANLLCRLYDS